MFISLARCRRLLTPSRTAPCIASRFAPLLLARSSHYDVLQVAEDSTHDQIKEQYYHLSKKFHPDVNPELEKEESSAKFRAIAAAWSILGNVDERRRYDKLRLTPGKERLHSTQVTVDPEYSKHLRDRFHLANRDNYRKSSTRRSSSVAHRLNTARSISQNSKGGQYGIGGGSRQAMEAQFDLPMGPLLFIVFCFLMYRAYLDDR